MTRRTPGESRNITRRDAIALAASAVTATGASGLLQMAHASAADGKYPTKTIKMVVPFPPGGGPDLLARTLGQRMGAAAGWNWVIENRPGAAGNLGTEAVARAPADGYTLLLGHTAALAVNVTLFDKLPYDPLRDFAGVGLVAISPSVLVTSSNSPYKTFRQVIDAARKDPGKITLGFSGNGTVSHLSGALIEKSAGVKLQAIPYKGASQGIIDVISGNVDLYMSSYASLLQYIRGGKARALAVTSAARSAVMPDVPTIAEQGFDGFEAVSWFGLLAPAGTPAAIVKQLNAALNEALAESEVIEKFRTDGAMIQRGSSEDFSKFMRSEVERWRVAVKESGAKLE